MRIGFIFLIYFEPITTPTNHNSITRVTWEDGKKNASTKFTLRVKEQELQQPFRVRDDGELMLMGIIRSPFLARSCQ
jgi:hypothetical protein